MDFYEITFFINDDNPAPRFEYQASDQAGWLKIGNGRQTLVAMHLPFDAAKRAAVISKLRTSFNTAIDQAEAADAALKAEGLDGLDAETAEPALAGRES